MTVEGSPHVDVPPSSSSLQWSEISNTVNSVSLSPMAGLPDVSEEPVMQEKRKKGWRAELILQTFHHFTFVTTHSPTLPLLYLHHSSFSNPSVASPMSQPFSNPSFASPTSLALHLRHLASCPCYSHTSYNFNNHKNYLINKLKLHQQYSDVPTLKLGWVNYFFKQKF